MHPHGPQTERASSPLPASGIVRSEGMIGFLSGGRRAFRSLPKYYVAIAVIAAMVHWCGSLVAHSLKFQVEVVAVLIVVALATGKVIWRAWRPALVLAADREGLTYYPLLEAPISIGWDRVGEVRVHHALTFAPWLPLGSAVLITLRDAKGFLSSLSASQREDLARNGALVGGPSCVFVDAADLPLSANEVVTELRRIAGGRGGLATIAA